MHQEILEKVIAIVADKNDMAPETITAESRFREDLGIDSLDQVEMVMELEDKFNVKFSDEEMEGISTVQDAVKLVEKKLQK